MKVIFCSTMFTDYEKEFNKTKEPRTISGHIFQENLLLGLQQNGVDVSVINVPRVKHYPVYTEFFLRTVPFKIDGVACGITVGIINLKWLNYITAGIQIFRYARQAIKANGDEPIFFLVFNTHMPQTPALLLLRRRFSKIRLCDVIGDLHGNNGVAVRQNNLHGKMVQLIGKFSDQIAHQFDCFGLLTAEIACAVNVSNKPYVVMEGFYRLKSPQNIAKIPMVGEKLIFYAGYLAPDYGIEHMLHAFELIKDQNYQLVLAGYGEDMALMQRYIEKDERIQFLGLISPEEVRKWQEKATVLVSPRTSEHNFVKYSFPSKTLECLASGKPYIAHKLPCDPPEYADYIQYARDESDEALRDKIIEVCEMPPQKRYEIGKRARDFVIREKNPKTMCKKIVALFESM